MRNRSWSHDSRECLQRSRADTRNKFVIFDDFGKKAKIETRADSTEKLKRKKMIWFCCLHSKGCEGIGFIKIKYELHPISFFILPIERTVGQWISSITSEYLPKRWAQFSLQTNWFPNSHSVAIRAPNEKIKKKHKSKSICRWKRTPQIFIWPHIARTLVRSCHTFRIVS